MKMETPEHRKLNSVCQAEIAIEKKGNVSL